MWIEAPFEIKEHPRNGERHRQVYQSSRNIYLVGRKGVRDDRPGNTGYVEKRDGAGEGAPLQHQDDFIGISGKRQSEGPRQDNASQLQTA